MVTLMASVSPIHPNAGGPPPVFQNPDIAALDACEHGVLQRMYADAQTRCSAHICAQHAEIQRLQAELVRLRARAIVRETAWLWEHEARMALHAQLAVSQTPAAQATAGAAPAQPPAHGQSFSQRATELLICQTGCVSHDDHWRQNDHCQRTGQPCLLVAQPDALDVLHSTQRTPPLPSAAEL